MRSKGLVEWMQFDFFISWRFLQLYKHWNKSLNAVYLAQDSSYRIDLLLLLYITRSLIVFLIRKIVTCTIETPTEG